MQREHHGDAAAGVPAGPHGGGPAGVWCGGSGERPDRGALHPQDDRGVRGLQPGGRQQQSKACVLQRSSTKNNYLLKKADNC